MAGRENSVGRLGSHGSNRGQWPTRSLATVLFLFSGVVFVPGSVVVCVLVSRLRVVCFVGGCAVAIFPVNSHRKLVLTAVEAQPLFHDLASKGGGRSRKGSGRSRKGGGRSRKGSGRSRKGSGLSRKGSKTHTVSPSRGGSSGRT